MKCDHSNYSISQLMTFSFERGGGLTAKEIAERIGEDAAFDEKVIRVSTKRFKEIMNAYKQGAISEAQTEKAILLPKGDKIFLDTNDYYLVNRYILRLFVDALKYGSFSVPDDKSSREKAEQAKVELLLYLIEVGSPDAEVLSGITVDEPDTEALTLDKFIDSKRDEAKEAFSSYRQKEYSNDRFNRLFSKIKQDVKAAHENFIKDNKRRARKGKLLVFKEQMIDMAADLMEKQTYQQGKVSEAIKSIDDAFNEKALYAHTLQQKHDYFYQKDNHTS